MFWPSVKQLDSLSDHQRSVSTESLRGRVGILAGSPGTGKTFTAGCIIKAIAEQHSTHEIALAAPTGKAAQRLSAAIRSHGVNLEATTFHRLLAPQRNGHDSGGWDFYYHKNQRLPHCFYIFDEMSMTDTDTGAALFQALPDDAHVLLIGDQGQLPPVGHGAVFRDLIAASQSGANIGLGELTEIQRNAGDIVQACRAIKAGRQFRPSGTRSIGVGGNLKHHECRNPADSIRMLSRLVESAAAFRRPDGRPLDPKWDIQIITATNEKSELSRVPLNEHLQALLNPHGERCEGNRFRVGDKVICTSNSWLPLWDELAGEAWIDTECEATNPLGREKVVKEFVANGEIGCIVAVEPKAIRVRFDAPQRCVRVPGGKDFELAYCVSFHKSQGSQWPVVILMIDGSASARRVASRELWYTGLSRAETLCVTIGQWSELLRQCKRNALVGRKTFLKELILENAA